MIGFSLRPVTNDDQEFLYRLFAETNANTFEAAGLDRQQIDSLLRMQFQAQHQQYQQSFPNSEDFVIESGRECVGRLWLCEHEPDFRIVDIRLLRDFQNRGIGSQVIRHCIQQAETQRKDLRLSVANNNPARHIYERLGFQGQQTNGIQLEMVYLCPARNE